MENKKPIFVYAGTDVAGDQNIKGKSSKMNGSEIYVLVVAAFVVLLFGYTAVNKIASFKIFVFQMQLAPLSIMKWAAPYLGVVIPLMELAIVGCLIPEKTRRWALIASLVLMSSFELYLIWMHISGLDLPCACGGIIAQMNWLTHMIFNAVVILLIALAINFNKNNKKMEIENSD